MKQQNAQEVYWYAPDSAGFFSPIKEKKETISNYLSRHEDKENGKSLCIFDLDETLTKKGFKEFKKKLIPSQQQPHLYREIIKDNIKNLKEIAPIINSLEKAGYIIIVLTGCEDKEYVKTVTSLIQDEINNLRQEADEERGFCFSYIKINQKERDLAILELLTEIVLKTKIKIKKIIVVDDDEENIKRVDESGGKYVDAIRVDSNSLYLNRLSQYTHQKIFEPPVTPKRKAFSRELFAGKLSRSIGSNKENLDPKNSSQNLSQENSNQDSVVSSLLGY